MKKERIWAGMVAAVGMAALASGQGIAAWADDNANDERGTGSGSQSSKSHAECGGKKSESKNGDRSGSGIGEGLRTLGVLDRPGGH